MACQGCEQRRLAFLKHTEQIRARGAGPLILLAGLSFVAGVIFRLVNG